jgi:hypothetical protein
MNRLIAVVLLGGAFGHVVWSQTVRQPNPGRAVAQAPADARAASLGELDAAARQLTEINGSHRALMDTNAKMTGVHSSLNEEVGEVCRIAQTSRVSPAEAARALNGLCELQVRGTLEYLELQRQIQSESRRFTTLGNAMKTRHDTAKAAINNVR